MIPIVPKRTWLTNDVNGKPRWCVSLDDGRQFYRSRLIMMNFLHTNYIPNKIHVHHTDEMTDRDEIDNLELLSLSDHMRFHNPRTYTYGASETEDKKAYMDGYNKYYWSINKDNPEYRCKQLENANKKYQTVKDDPDFKDKRNSKDRNAYARRKQDPVWASKRRTQKRNWEIKNKEEKNALSQLQES